MKLDNGKVNYAKCIPEQQVQFKKYCIDEKCPERKWESGLSIQIYVRIEGWMQIWTQCFLASGHDTHK